MDGSWWVWMTVMPVLLIALVALAVYVAVRFGVDHLSRQLRRPASPRSTLEHVRAVGDEASGGFTAREPADPVRRSQ